MRPRGSVSPALSVGLNDALGGQSGQVVVGFPEQVSVNLIIVRAQIGPLPIALSPVSPSFWELPLASRFPLPSHPEPE